MAAPMMIDTAIYTGIIWIRNSNILLIRFQDMSFHQHLHCIVTGPHHIDAGSDRYIVIISVGGSEYGASVDCHHTDIHTGCVTDSDAAVAGRNHRCLCLCRAYAAEIHQRHFIA